MTKVCTKCNEPKPLDDFPKKRTMRSGKHSWCRTCLATYQEFWEQTQYERRLLIKVRYRAKKQGRPFTLTSSDIHIPETCPIFGIPLQKHTGGGKHPHPDSPSVDCVIPELGYVPSNVRIISYRANCIKNDGTAEEHEAITVYIRSHR